MSISKKIKSISNLIQDNSIIADIGTDHGYLIVEILKNNNNVFVYGVDINEKPLHNAKQNLNKFNIKKGYELIISDGFQNIRNKNIDTAVLAGIGQYKILEILNNINDSVTNIIFASSDKSNKIREWISNNSFKIIFEDIVYENGFFYEIVQCVKSNKKIHYNKDEIFFGPILYYKKSNLFISKWNSEILKLKNILSKIPLENQNFNKIKNKILFIERIFTNEIKTTN